MQSHDREIRFRELIEPILQLPKELLTLLAVGALLVFLTGLLLGLFFRTFGGRKKVREGSGSSNDQGVSTGTVLSAAGPPLDPETTSPAGLVASTLRRDSSLEPQTHDPTADVSKLSPPKSDKGFEVWTMIGIVRFRSSHAAGRFGDWLTAIYYTSKGYTKLRSKRTSIHGIDGVYIKQRPQKMFAYEILVVENKINSGKLKPDQLSVSGIRRRCEELLAVADQELNATANVVLKALDEHSSDRLVRLLVIHDLEAGVSARHHVDEDGRRTEEVGRWQNHKTVERSLIAKLRKGEIIRVEKEVGS